MTLCSSLQPALPGLLRIFVKVMGIRDGRARWSGPEGRSLNAEGLESQITTHIPPHLVALPFPALSCAAQVSSFHMGGNRRRDEGNAESGGTQNLLSGLMGPRTPSLDVQDKS